MVTTGLLASLSWLALAGPASDRFEPGLHRDLVGFEDVDFDSGWFPANGPVQLRFYAHAADSIDIEMLGDGLYDWDAETIAFAGDAGGGRFSIDVGLELEASVRFDVAGLVWESEILGPWDYAITSEAFYTPYLLPGNPERPAVIDDHTDGVPVASVPIVPDILVASGNLEVTVAADITAELAGLRIEATTPADGAIVDAEGVPSPLTPTPLADPLVVEGVLVATLQTAPVLIVRPHLVMSILGQDYEIFGIDIPIALPETDEQLDFEPVPMQFAAPEPAPGGSGGSGGVDESGGDEAASASAGSTGEGTSGETDTDTGAAPACCDDDVGCGCRSTPSRASGLLSLLLLGALGRRRRPSPRASG